METPFPPRNPGFGARDRGTGLNDGTNIHPPQRKRPRFLSRFVRAAGKAAAEEFIASYIARDRGKNGRYYTSRIPKMMVYGAFIDATLTHYLLKGLKWLFKNLTHDTYGVVQLWASMILVVPLRALIHMVSIALIAGARTLDEMRATVSAAFLPMLSVVAFAVPLALAFAHKFIPERWWAGFFGSVTFCIDTFVNAGIKKRRLAALRQMHFSEDQVRRTDSGIAEDGGRRGGSSLSDDRKRRTGSSISEDGSRRTDTPKSEDRRRRTDSRIEEIA